MPPLPHSADRTAAERKHLSDRLDPPLTLCSLLSGCQDTAWLVLISRFAGRDEASSAPAFKQRTRVQYITQCMPSSTPHLSVKCCVAHACAHASCSVR